MANFPLISLDGDYLTTVEVAFLIGRATNSVKAPGQIVLNIAKWGTTEVVLGPQTAEAYLDARGAINDDHVRFVLVGVAGPELWAAADRLKPATVITWDGKDQSALAGWITDAVTPLPR